MTSNQPILSSELLTLKEKINLKKLDREVYIHQTEAVLQSKKDERNALRVGNACLTHMTSKQLMMPMTLNAAVFAQNNKDKLRMQRLPLHVSIGVNDSRLFKYGKRLLKQDYYSRQGEACLEQSKLDLEWAKTEAQASRADYEKRCEQYLHKQVMVEDSRDRENAAKLTHHRLQKILDELNKDLVAIPLRIKKKEKEIAEKRLELQDFTSLRDRASKYMEVEKEALKPVNLEMASVTQHFDHLILETRNELDDRRKNVTLAKFLAEREANPLSFGEIANVIEIQFKKRNKAIAARDVITALMDATMVSDIENVVDCFKDQNDLVVLLQKEKKLREELNEEMRANLARINETNQFLKYDSRKTTTASKQFEELVLEETADSRYLHQMDQKLSKQNKLLSSLQLIVSALAAKLRPIKLADSSNIVTGNLIEDVDMVSRKLEKMLNIIKNNTVPVGPVRPLLLDLFKEERLPPDSIRVDTTPTGLTASMTSFEKFEADSPGLVTREMLKARAAECQAENERKRKGKHRGRKK